MKRIPLLLLLLLWGCGTRPIVTSELTPPPEEEAATTARSFTITGGVITNFLFTAGPGYNGVVPPVDTNSTLEGDMVNEAEADNQLNLRLSQTTPSGPPGAPIVNVRKLAFGILSRSTPLEAGQVFQLIANPEDPGAYVTLVDATTQSGVETIHQTWTHTAASNGTLTVTDLSDSQVELDFTLQNIQPNLNLGNAQGTFTVTGHLQADLSEGVP